MKKISILIIFSLFIFACNSTEKKGNFKISGELKNADDQKVYLEHITFSQNPPSILDTAEMVNGKFTIKGNATDEGLYRLKFEKNSGYLIINDQPEITFNADSHDLTVKSVSVSSPATQSLYKFIMDLDSIHAGITAEAEKVEEYAKQKQDSLATLASISFNSKNEAYKSYLEQYMDTAKSPIVTLFAFTYAQDLDLEKVKNILAKLQKNNPGNSAVEEVKRNFDAYVAAQNSVNGANASAITVGQQAPDFTLPDVDGKPFSLSSLKGKYVLVDFWASWCAPCRDENPNVVANYHEFKNKNFTILGVSLDKEKSAWLKAIKDDGLEWKQISDLKFWNSEVAALYNIQGIPFNVLLDPQGKIIATDLRGDGLRAKLSQVLQ